MIGRLKNSARKRYNKFSKSDLYQNLKKIGILRSLKLKAGKIIWKKIPYNFPLHGDPITIKIFEKLIGKGKIDTIVETGTFRGFTTSLLAKKFPDIKIYTCEIDEFNYAKAKKRLNKFPNVKIFKDSSPKFLKHLIENNILEGKALFYLDAHWLDEWPLEEELKIISRNLKSAVVVIDDFKVPGDRRFKFDKYKGKECSLKIVLPNIEKTNKYNALLPNYGEEVLKRDISHPDLVGYLVLFQNMAKDFKTILNEDFVKRFFRNSSNLIKPGHSKLEIS